MTRNEIQAGEVRTAVSKLLAYCQANDWAGYDPYDALNSRIFEAAPFLNYRLPRLVLTQALKRSPINVRSLLLVPKKQNAKGIALFLSAFLKLSKAGVVMEEGLAGQMVERLIALRSEGHPYFCWGYSFPWQTRKEVVPAGAPNLVCTTFAAGALLDAYEQNGDARCLAMTVSAAEYMLERLYWTEGDSVAGFSYPMPGVRGRIHNANFLGAALFSRLYQRTGEKKFLEPALRLARYSVSQQMADGSWYYGESPTQQWIDNFHTGFNLTALQTIGREAGTAEFESSVRRGWEFYKAHFFRDDGAPRYFHNRTYPLDAHCVAQSILTPLSFKELDPAGVALARSVFNWAMKNMWDKRGFFYYRVLRLCTIRTPYMRWTEAWMLLALAALLAECEPFADPVQRRNSDALAEVC
jgi:hypothetical protein